ncbi:hypothetical protein, partial [Faecalibaculum rodentium]|uniref:hypothetical protein n=1 Tax=Faecalibaculum rodentium TaxID=1702221 RepID=UPI0023EFF4A4
IVDFHHLDVCHAGHTKKSDTDVTKRAKIWRIRARKSGEAKLQDIIFIYSSPPEKYELLKTRLS